MASTSELLCVRYEWTIFKKIWSMWRKTAGFRPFWRKCFFRNSGIKSARSNPSVGRDAVKALMQFKWTYLCEKEIFFCRALFKTRQRNSSLDGTLHSLSVLCHWESRSRCHQNKLTSFTTWKRYENVLGVFHGLLISFWWCSTTLKLCALNFNLQRV